MQTGRPASSLWCAGEPDAQSSSSKLGLSAIGWQSLRLDCRLFWYKDDSFNQKHAAAAEDPVKGDYPQPHKIRLFVSVFHFEAFVWTRRPTLPRLEYYLSGRVNFVRFLSEMLHSAGLQTVMRARWHIFLSPLLVSVIVLIVWSEYFKQACFANGSRVPCIWFACNVCFKYQPQTMDRIKD